MRIPRSEFEKLQPVGPTFEEQVLNVLRDNREYAYNRFDIAMAIDQRILLNDPSALQVGALLDSLIARKLVVSRWRDSPTGPEQFYTVP